MPEICRYLKIIISIHWNDYDPPHFNARYYSYRASIDIKTLGVLSGSLPPRIHGSVVTWASVNRQLLIESWNKYQTKDKPEKFPYYGADLSWIIEDAGWYEDYKVKVWFRDGSIKIVNLEATIFSSESSLFKPLRDKDSFMELRYDSSLETVVWPNGADIAPEYLYENGEPAPAIEEEFKARKIS